MKDIPHGLIKIFIQKITTNDFLFIFAMSPN